MARWISISIIDASFKGQPQQGIMIQLRHHAGRAEVGQTVKADKKPSRYLPSVPKVQWVIAMPLERLKVEAIRHSLPD
jgi:hypothetical protein